MAVLQVVVDAGCGVCSRAWALADQARAWFPMLRVEVVDLADPAAVLPEAAVAVPAYLLDGRVISLGNPAPATLRRTLAVHLDMQGGEGGYGNRA